MYGAMLGNIIGSRFEFERGRKTKEFAFFMHESQYTDDSVMTVAVAEALMNVGPDAVEDKVKAELIRLMKEWGRRTPYAGYGGMFHTWLFTDRTEPYGSYGNGSAMRVSPAGCPDELKRECEKRIEPEMREVLKRFVDLVEKEKL